MQHIN